MLNRYYRDHQGNFEGFIKQGEVKRYIIQIAAENIPLSKQTFEISWDGTWPENSSGHLVIQDIFALAGVLCSTAVEWCYHLQL